MLNKYFEIIWPKYPIKQPYFNNRSINVNLKMLKTSFTNLLLANITKAKKPVMVINEPITKPIILGK